MDFEKEARGFHDVARHALDLILKRMLNDVEPAFEQVRRGALLHPADAARRCRSALPIRRGTTSARSRCARQFAVARLA